MGARFRKSAGRAVLDAAFPVRRLAGANSYSLQYRERLDSTIPSVNSSQTQNRGPFRHKEAPWLGRFSRYGVVGCGLA